MTRGKDADRPTAAGASPDPRPAEDPAEAPAEAEAEAPAEPEVPEGTYDGWQGRLVIDAVGADGEPTVVGTDLTVEYVLAMVLDGMETAELRRHYPELTTHDVRACL